MKGNTIFRLFFLPANVQLPVDKFPPKEDNKLKQATGTPGEQKKPKKVVLNSSDNLFAEIRDMNFSAVGPVLSREAKRITAEYEVYEIVFMVDPLLIIIANTSILNAY